MTTGHSDSTTTLLIVVGIIVVAALVYMYCIREAPVPHKGSACANRYGVAARYARSEREGAEEDEDAVPEHGTSSQHARSARMAHLVRTSTGLHPADEAASAGVAPEDTASFVPKSQSIQGNLTGANTRGVDGSQSERTDGLPPPRKIGLNDRAWLQQVRVPLNTTSCIAFNGSSYRDEAIMNLTGCVASKTCPPDVGPTSITVAKDAPHTGKPQFYTD